MRPVIPYYGGKYRAAGWIISHFPPHKTYVEPFGGAASVLMAKPRGGAEIYNDLNSDVVNYFRILRDPEQTEKLAELMRLTPYARDEYNEAWLPADDPIESARRLLIRSFMSYGGGRQKSKPGFRSRDVTSGAHRAQLWATYPDYMTVFAERLQGVVIENKPALEVIASQDHPATLFYVDPPYVRSARADQDKSYVHEMSDDDHRELSEKLHQVKGMVIISGYECALYDELYRGWPKSTTSVRGNFDKKIEVVWMNYSFQRTLL